MAVRRIDFGEIPGVAVGHAESEDGGSGVTVVRFDRPAPTVVDVRGGASATYDTASLSLDATFGRRWAVFFSGGSLYGLDAARGVRTEILQRGGGHRAFRNPNVVVPISGAALFDLPVRSGSLPDYLPLGFEASRRSRAGRVATGRVGAGAGATVGKYLGRGRAMAGGLGAAANRDPAYGALGVLVVVNAVGAVRDPGTGSWVAGARGPRGAIVPPQPSRVPRGGAAHTTLAIVVTELAVGRPVLARVAAMVHSGLSAAIVPFHSAVDGDVVFAATTDRRSPRARESRPGGLADHLGTRAAHLAIEATLAAVRPRRSPSRRRSLGRSAGDRGHADAPVGRR